MQGGLCTAVSGSTVTGISGYIGGPHNVSAYSDSACNYHVASASFTLPDATLTATAHSNLAVSLFLEGGPHNWWFRINAWGTCTGTTGRGAGNIRGYTGGPHSVSAYSDSGCNSRIASASFTVPDPTLTATVDSSDWSVDLTLTNWPHNWWFRINLGGTCTPASGTTVENIRGYRSGEYVVVAFPNSHCGSHSSIAGDVLIIPDATLTTAINNDSSVNLTLANGPRNWWFRINSWGTCTAAPGSTVSNIGGYTGGPHTVSAYTDSGCNYHVASTAFTLP